MKSVGPGRLMSVYAGAFLAWCVVMPGSALGECSSHFVPILPPSSGVGIGLESLDLAGDSAVSDLANLPDRPKPCNGEMCSGRPAMPLSADSPKTHRVGTHAILVVALRLMALRSIIFPLAEGGIHAIHSSRSIFHPPRLSRSRPTS